MTILHLPCHLLIEKERFESGYDREVLKLFSRFPEFVKSWLLTLGKWASVVVFPRAYIATAAVYTAIGVLRLEVRQSCDLLLDFKQRLKVPKVFRECTA